ncbi:MAG: hypothetical protein U5K43_12095 [Halofilum sp. (in: g-proteobacteria)]|nr:hypothetical protein [Halofilum sp. (in: g-proteobacteria)]
MFAAERWHDQDGIVDHRAHQDQEAEHGDHVERLLQGVEADQRQQAAAEVEQPEPADAAAGDAERDRRS